MYIFIPKLEGKRFLYLERYYNSSIDHPLIYYFPFTALQ